MLSPCLLARLYALRCNVELPKAQILIPDWDQMTVQPTDRQDQPLELHQGTLQLTRQDRQPNTNSQAQRDTGKETTNQTQTPRHQERNTEIKK